MLHGASLGRSAATDSSERTGGRRRLLQGEQQGSLKESSGSVLHAIARGGLPAGPSAALDAVSRHQRGRSTGNWAARSSIAHLISAAVVRI